MLTNETEEEQRKLPSRTNDKALLCIYLGSPIDIFAVVHGVVYRDVSYWLIPTSQEVGERETLYPTVHQLYPRIIWHQDRQRDRDNLMSFPHQCWQGHRAMSANHAQMILPQPLLNRPTSQDQQNK